MGKTKKALSLGPFAINLSRLLKEKKISARSAAKIAGVPPSTLAQWLEGVMPLDLEAVHRLAVYFNVDFQFLLIGKMPEPKAPRPEDFFDVASESSLTGMFQIEIKRLVPKGGKS